MRDWSSRDGAYALAARITEYWEKRGRQVNVFVLPPAETDTPSLSRGIWAIRSDLQLRVPR